MRAQNYLNCAIVILLWAIFIGSVKVNAHYMVSISTAILLLGSCLFSLGANRVEQLDRMDVTCAKIFYCILMAIFGIMMFAPIELVFAEKLITFESEELPNFAAEKMGARVVDTPETVSVVENFVTVLGVMLKTIRSDPYKAINPGVEPEHSWCFEGSEGKLVIQLPTTVHVTAVSLQHVDQCKIPEHSLTSAPKDFIVSVSEDDSTGKWTQIGKGRYSYGKTTRLRNQMFYFESNKIHAKLVQFHILNNWGNETLTHLYTVRVHGEPSNSSTSS